MKVLGKTGGRADGYIVQITAEEAERLTGISGVAYGGTELGVGSFYPLAKIWRALAEVLSAKEQLAKAASALRSCAVLAETQLPILEAVQPVAEGAES